MKRTKVTREYRDLTPAEAERVRKIRAEAEREKEKLLAQGRRQKAGADRRAQARSATKQAENGSKSRSSPIGARLRRLRTQRVLTQQAVAESAAKTKQARQLGATARGLQSALSQIESGVIKNPGVLTLDVLCQGLGVSLADVLKAR
jgi:Skp family chaperone for outer membrane proteins